MNNCIYKNFNQLKSKTVYSMGWIGFGDLLAFINHLNDLSISKNKVFYISNVKIKPKKFSKNNKLTRINAEEDINQILDILDIKDNIRVIKEDGIPVMYSVQDYHKQYKKTKINWHNSDHEKKVCYQIFSPHDKRKNISYKRYKKFRSILNNRDYKMIKVGLPMTIKDIVYHLSTCSFFFGIDSGMAHLAQSSRTPSFLKYYGTLKNEIGKTICLNKSFPNKKYNSFNSLDELFEIC